MKRNFIFTFILLATLSVVNAVSLHKRGVTKFNTCPIEGTPTLTVTAPDTVIPKKTATFGVFGILNNPVTAGNTLLAIEFADESGKNILEKVYYQVFTDSFPAKSIVSITASSVRTPKELPDVYTIGIAIGDQNVGDPITPLKIYGCTYAVVANKKPHSDSLEDYPFGAMTGE